MSFNRKRRLKNPNPFNPSCGKGSVVTVLTGRTVGKLMVVTDFYTDKYGKCMAFVCDGVRYKTDCPKLKAASHLRFEYLSDAATDEEIIKLLSNQ